MNILHISDLHFGPRHWEGDDQVLLAKINSYDADIVINTGDNTTDGLETAIITIPESTKTRQKYLFLNRERGIEPSFKGDQQDRS